MRRQIGVVFLVIALVALTAILTFTLIRYLEQEEDEEPPTPPDVSIRDPLTAVLEGYTLNDAIRLEVGDDLQAVVEAHPPGSVFILAAGEHRGHRITPRDGDVFIGELGATLSGAVILEDFEEEVDGLWVTDVGALVLEGWRSGECAGGDENVRCNFANDLYVDNQPLQQAPSLEQINGRWFLDYDTDRLYVAFDPAESLVELSRTVYAFTGPARNVIITGLTIEKYAGPGQVGALHGVDSTNWVVAHNLVRLNSGVGINVGEGMRVLYNRVLNNGQMGVSGVGDNMLIEGNEIAHNNYADFNFGWEAGGAKFVLTNNLVARNNYIHHNGGPGLWTDIDNMNVLFEDNIVFANRSAGIFHEIGFTAVIRNNISMLNNPQSRLMFAGAQILVSSSSDVQVYGNTVVVAPQGGNGIAVVQQDRGGSEIGEYFATNVRVHDNTVIYLGTEGETGAAVDGDNNSRFWEEAVIEFDNNAYFVQSLDQQAWGWLQQGRTWDDIQAQGQEQNSTISTEIPASAMVIPPWQPGGVVSTQPSN